jgi:DNA mismatch repair protein MutL
VLFLELPSDLVDVNVHPQKAEVRFADARAVTDAVFRVLSLELGKAFGLAPASRPMFGGARVNANEPSRSPFPPPTAPAVGEGDVAAAMALGLDWLAPSPASADPRVQGGASEGDPWGLGSGPSAPDAERAATYPPLVAAGDEPLDPFSSLRFLAQVKSTFLVCEGKAGLYVLDQHAAAERVTFHRLKTAFVARTIAVQPLLFPLVLEVTEGDAALVEERHDELLAAGIDARTVGSHRVAVHGVPQLLARASPERLFRDLLAEASRAGRGAFSHAIDLALATMACHGSIRAGDRVSPEEAASLLAALGDVDFAGHCPHGRPIVTMLRFSELERRVGRR